MWRKTCFRFFKRPAEGKPARRHIIYPPRENSFKAQEGPVPSRHLSPKTHVIRPRCGIPTCANPGTCRENISPMFFRGIFNSFEAKVSGCIFCFNLITQPWHSFPLTLRFPVVAWTPTPKCIRSIRFGFVFVFWKYWFCFLCSGLRPSFEWADGGDVCFCPIVSFVPVLGFSSGVFCWWCFADQKLLWFMRFLEIDETLQF